ncbi:MAG: hypothetical protein ACOYOJ_01675, partial [Alsobacter sp.]
MRVSLVHRRALTISTALVLSALLGPSGVFAQQRTVAEQIWSGGPIYTMNDKAMRAEAVAVAGGKILAVGR